MNCWKAQTLFSALADGELGTAETEALTAHMESCPQCARAHNRVLSHPSITCPELPADLELGLWAELDRRIEAGMDDEGARPLARFSDGLRDGWFRDLRLPLPVAVGYGLLLMVSVAWGLQNMHRAATLDGELAQSRAAIESLATRVASLPASKSAPTNTLPLAPAPEHEADATPAAIAPKDPLFAPAVLGRVEDAGDRVVGPSIVQ